MIEEGNTSTAHATLNPPASFPFPTKVPSVSPPVLSTAMSEKLKEFVDIPQQFIRDGNQVCNLPHLRSELRLMQYCGSSSPGVQSPRTKVG